MTKKTFDNPIISGGYPDPSICRVGDDYYMVTSSFYYFPGLPIFHSKDLVHWEQIGNAISRAEQLDYRNCDSSEGLWAATLRYNNGVFYIVDTLDVEGRKYRYNFIITATDPAGEWSNATIIEDADGIDPSLYFDDEDNIWFCANMIPDTIEYPTHKAIYLQQLDPVTFQFTGERHIIYDGSIDYSQYMEGAHIYHIEQYYYLITACGGTQTNHCVNIARGEKLLGPYEPCPRNPIVTNRGLRIINELGVSVVGHGDLVETQNGEWFMVLLGVRPYKKDIEDYDCFQPRKWIRTPDRNKNAQFNLGREVFLIPIGWDYDEWPLVNNKNGMVNLTERRPNLPEYRPPLYSRIDNFENPALGIIWCMRRPVKEPFYSLTANSGYLRLFLGAASVEDKETPSLLVRRQQHYNFQACTSMEFTPHTDSEEAGLVITQNEKFSFIILKQLSNSTPIISLYRIINGQRELISSRAIADGKLYLSVEGSVGYYSFYYGTSEHQMIPLALKVDGELLSTLVADGFVGSYLGVYASSKHKISTNYADFDWFRYEIIEN